MPGIAVDDSWETVRQACGPARMLRFQQVFASLKKGGVSQKTLRIDQLEQGIDQWFQSYNEEQPHSGKCYFGKTPRETFDDFRKLVKQKMIDQHL